MIKKGAAHARGRRRHSVFARQQERGHAAVGFGDDPERVFAKPFARLCGVDGEGRGDARAVFTARSLLAASSSTQGPSRRVHGG